MAEILGDSTVGDDLGRSIYAVRRIVGELSQKRDLQPAMKSALALVGDAARLASVLSLSATLGKITDNEFGRDIIEARMILAGAVARHKGNPVLSQGKHWENALGVLSAALPAFDDAQTADERERVVEAVVHGIELEVGRRPSNKTTLATLSLLRQTSRGNPHGRPTRSRAIRTLFEEIGLPTKTTDNRNFSTAISKILHRLIPVPDSE